MALTVIIHFAGEDAIVADMDQLPEAANQYIVVRNPRRKDGKSIGNIEANAKAILYPFSRITFVELMSEPEDVAASDTADAHQGTTIFGFFRDED
ncbi:MAG: hypothetical protein ACR2LS_07800 [Thermomicrobiales bacterium]